MTWILPKQLISAFAPDTEALTLDSAELSRICEQSLMRRSKHSPAKTYLREWKLGNLMRLQSGVISSPSLGKSFLDWWTSSLEVTHANRSHPQESGLEQKILATCGPTSQREFDFSNPSAASLKTSKDISAWGCPTSSKTWQEWVTKRRLEYSARLNAVRHTSESGSSSWPSPVASEVRQGFQDRSRGMKGSQESLTTVVVKSWPTPAARDHKDSGENVDMEKVAAKCKLAGVVAIHGPPVLASSNTPGSLPGLWQTATVSTGAHKQKDGSMIDKLDQQVKNWATPDVSDRRSDNCRQIGLSNQTQGKLNPRWVETLMGLPVGWTMPSCASPVTIERMNSDSSATELSQQQQNERSGH